MKNRMDRVNNLIQKEISKIITEELRDSKIDGFVTVTKVDTSKDFSISKVYVSILGAKNNVNTLSALKKASGYVRKRLAGILEFRKIPEIVFVFDDSIEYGYKMDTLFKQIEKELNLSEEKEDMEEE